jgi:predicted transcriptional regulator
MPDPRCARPLESRVLALVAATPGLTARDVATTIGLPLRTVQLALRTLVDDGACAVDRDGARVAYVVDDTTFGRPTTARLRAPGALGSR